MFDVSEELKMLLQNTYIGGEIFKISSPSNKIENLEYVNRMNEEEDKCQ